MTGQLPDLSRLPPPRLPPPGAPWPPRAQPRVRTPTVPGLVMVVVTVGVLLAGVLLPLVKPTDDPLGWWRGGLQLVQFGPHLLGGQAGAQAIFVYLFLAALAQVVLLLLGVARLVGTVLWVVTIVVSSLSLLLTSLMVVGLLASANERTTAGVGAYCLPAGALLTFLCCVIAQVRSAWVRPRAW